MPSGQPDVASQRPRVLLIAELANPEWSSAPLVGWCLFEALSRLADVHLVTHVRNEENIVKTGLSRERFTTIDNRSVERPLDAIASTLRGTRDPGGGGQTLVTAFASFAYYRFEQMLWQRFGERIRAHAFDLVHRLTPLNSTMPSILAPWCAKAGVPFVIGPLQGGLPWPRQFTSERRREGEWLGYIRSVHKLMPGYASTRRDAAGIIVGSRNTLGQIAARYRDKCVYIPENAIIPERFDVTVSGPVTSPLRVAFVGRMVPCKMPGLLLEAALPLVKQGLVELDFFGDGPELPELKARAAAEGVDGAVSFAGWVRHTELKERLARAHVFGFPSIHEFGGGSVLEAMALGLVPIVVDYGGPPELVSPSTGFAIPMGPREELVRGIRTTLERLLRNPEVIRPMGARARARVMHNFTWDAKAAQFLEVYRWVLGRRAKPDFGSPLPDPGDDTPDRAQPPP
jgi:glycosyltransferase involved in cell wall biosynthesis